jgi:WD40 repeat protein/pimeloyl-ACP methyl ester carboxylesterase
MTHISRVTPLIAVFLSLALASCRTGGNSADGLHFPREHPAAASTRVIGLPAGTDASDRIVDRADISPPEDALGPVVEFASSVPRYFTSPVQLALPLFELPSPALLPRMRAAYLTADGWLPVGQQLEYADHGGPVALVKSRHLGVSRLGGWYGGEWHLGAWCVRLMPDAGLDVTDAAKTATRVVVLVTSSWADAGVWDRVLKPLAGRLPRDTAVIRMFCMPGNRLADSGRLFLAELNRLAEANPTAEIHIVAHSAGAWVARYALEGTPGPKARVASLTKFPSSAAGSDWATAKEQSFGFSRTAFDEVMANQGEPARPLRREVARILMFEDEAGAALADLDPQSEFLTGLNRGWKAPPAGIKYQSAAAADDLLQKVGLPPAEREAGVLRGHTNSVWSVAFSPDGKTLASGSMHETVRVWDAATGKPIRTLAESASSVFFSSDGKTIIGGTGGALHMWDSETGQPVRTLEGPAGSSVCPMALSPDGKTVARGCYDGSVLLADAATGQNVRSLLGDRTPVRIVAFSPDGETLASAAYDGTVRLWSSPAGKLLGTLQGHRYAVNSVAFSQDCKLIATGSDDETVRLWDAWSGHCRQVFMGHAADVESVAFSPDGLFIASASRDKTVRLWSILSGSLQRTFWGHTDVVRSVAFSPDGKTIASASYDTTVRLWDVDGESPSMPPLGSDEHIRSIAFSPDGKTIASGMSSDTAHLWDVSTGRQLLTLPGNHTWTESLSFSPDGKVIATADSGYGAPRLWDTSTGQLLLTMEGEADHLQLVAFSPDGRTLASAGGDAKVWTWWVESGWSVHGTQRLNGVRSLDRIDTYEENRRRIGRVAFSPDRKTIVGASFDGAIRLWDVATGTLLQTLRKRRDNQFCCGGVAFSPDGKTIAAEVLDESGSSGRLRIWDASTGELLQTWERHTEGVSSLAFSPDGKTLAGVCGGTIQLWDAQTGTIQRVMEGDFGEIAFSPDGKTLASSGYSSGLWLWSLLNPRQPPRLIQ